MLLREQIVLITKFEDAERPFEELVIEIFVVNQEVEEIFAFDFVKNHLLFVTHKVVIYYLLHFIQSS